METELVDVVYKVGTNKKWRNKEELRYSIRSVVKNFKHLRDIIIVGELPSWAKGIKHIPAHNPYIDKDSNIIHKLLMACRDDSITDNFVNISDDQYFLKPVSKHQLLPYSLDSDLRKLAKTKFVSAFGKKLQSTINLLQEQGLPAHNYEGHIPYLINKKAYLEILPKYEYDRIGGLCGNTVYFNTLQDYTVLPVDHVRAYFRRSPTPAKRIDLTKGKLFLSVQTAALSKDMKNYIQRNFSEKSKYEQ